jgi:hypothetical protein
VRRLKLLAIALALTLIPVGCGKSHLKPAGTDRGKTDTAPSGMDTIFTEFFSNPPHDSGFHFVQVDEAGDTTALFMRWMVAQHPHIRLMGPVGGINLGLRKKFLGLHRIEIQNPGQFFTGAEDFCTDGGNGMIEGLTLEKLYETPDSICWRQDWRFIKRVRYINDTLDIARRVLVRRGEPYFVVRYDFTWVDAQPESLRFLWYLQRQTKMGKRRSRHEVGFAPGYGMVTRRHAFDAGELGYTAGMMNVGNPLATGIDTLPDGTPSHMSSDLKSDFGSGMPGFPAGFMRFNPHHDIYPEQFVWVDTTGHYVPSLHYDSAKVQVDTTDILDGEERFMIGRSKAILFRQGETKTMEYAVGRAALIDDLPLLAIPDVIWFDGTVARRPTK